MKSDDLQKRLEMFYREIGTLNDKYILPKPIEEYFDAWLKLDNIQHPAKFYFKEGIDLTLSIRQECVNIFMKHFPHDGVHGLVGYPKL